MTAQPDFQPPGRVAAIPHTIGAIGQALAGEQRLAFHAEVLAAEEATVAKVMRRWWTTAMLNAAPGADISRADAAAGRRLVSVDELLDRIESGSA
ncbi:hypothetical protein ACIQVO_36960 [Streptomyces sp. NPDC101062]|uniref:hypothetical protein n=1 Tax=unclassified Streptomyces TaxID=2593676 RepID=UPI00382A9FD3